MYQETPFAVVASLPTVSYLDARALAVVPHGDAPGAVGVQGLVDTLQAVAAVDPAVLYPVAAREGVGSLSHVGRPVDVGEAEVEVALEAVAVGIVDAAVADRAFQFLQYDAAVLPVAVVFFAVFVAFVHISSVIGNVYILFWGCILLWGRG